MCTALLNVFNIIDLRLEFIYQLPLAAVSSPNSGKKKER